MSLLEIHEQTQYCLCRVLSSSLVQVKSKNRILLLLQHQSHQLQLSVRKHSHGDSYDNEVILMLPFNDLMNMNTEPGEPLPVANQSPIILEPVANQSFLVFQKSATGRTTDRRLFPTARQSVAYHIPYIVV